MFRTKLFNLAALVVFLTAGSAAMAQRGGIVYHEVQVQDELGRDVTSISTVTVYAPSTTSAATIYMDAARTKEITQPLTSSSDNTTLSNGSFYWYGPDGWDYTIGDGTNTHTNGGHASLNASNNVLIFPSYLQSISSTTYTDAQTATFGSGSDWVIQGGATADLLSFTPASDNAEFRIGASGTSTNSDFNVYVGASLGLKLDAGTPSLTWDGGAATLNHNSNFNVGICSGTSTGAVTIGSSTSGAWAIDGTAGGTINADDSIGITCTAGTIDIDATGGDLGIDATTKSILIDAGEAADDAITITATGTAGGIDITSLGDIDITTTGAAGEDITITNTGGSIAITATENVQNGVHIEANGGTSESINLYANQGTGASAATEHDASIQLQSDVGGIGLYTGLNAANAIRLETNGGTSEGIILHSNQGTSVTEGSASVQLLSDAGGICLESNANLAQAIKLLADGGTTETITIQADQGTSTTEGASAIEILADVGSIELKSGLDGADAINIMVDSGTSSGITIFNDTGTGDESILLSSDVGGITVNAAAGSVDIEAVGATAGDLGLTAGDDMTVTVTGDLATTVTGSGAVTAAGYTITSTGAINTNGAFYETSRVTESHSASHTITDPTDIGTLMLVDTAAVVITLPAVSANATYSVMNVGADGTEIHVNPNDNDKICGGCGFAAALDDGDCLTNTGATADYGDMVELTYFDGTGWLITKMVGTWADGS